MRKCTGHPCTFFNGDDICDFCTERRNRLNDGVDSIKRGDVSLPVDAPAPSVSAEEPTASEAVTMFAAWLTCRDEAVTFSAHHDAAGPAELVEAFRKSQGWAVPRDDFTSRSKPYHAAAALSSQREDGR